MPVLSKSPETETGSLKQSLSQTVQAIVSDWLKNSFNLSEVEIEQALKPLNLETPKNPDFGDFAVNVSSLAKVAKLGPPQIAGQLQPLFEQALPNIALNLMGGFINFKLNAKSLAQRLSELSVEKNLGKNNSLSNTRCLLEFVSANPTGPLHIGHGRWVALGDSLARIMQHCGATVHKEFYINDAGSQVNNLAVSIWLRCLEILGTGVEFPQPKEGEKLPYYPGEYIKDIANDFLKDNKAAVEAAYIECNEDAFNPPQSIITSIKQFGMQAVLVEQKELLHTLRLDFDAWFSEKNNLYDTKLVEKIVDKLKATGKTYEEDGALWFKTTDYGDDQDRVLKKSDGSYTYLTPDIAYHDEKYSRAENYNLLINIWGADHHGYIPRMRAVIQALGHPVENFEVVLGQLVNLKIDGQKTRMGKRKTMVTLQELVEEVGVDPVRFWMISKSADTALDFDVDLAVSQSNENPVFYAQYAHARCCSILRNAIGTPANLSDGAQWEVLTEEELHNNLSTNNTQALTNWLNTLNTENPETYAALKLLLLRLDGFSEKIADAARLRSPHLVARYTLDVAQAFHHFYGLCRILTPNKSERLVRLTLIIALKNTLAQALELLGVSAPESM